MTGRRLAVALGGTLAVFVAATIGVSRGGAAARGSALSRDADGWLAARRYLEQRGARVHLLDAPFESDAPRPARRDDDRGGAQGGGDDPDAARAERGRDLGPGVLVLTFPWQRSPVAQLRTGLERHLRAGGTIVLAYTGEPLSWGEREVASALDLEWRDARARPPLHPLRWREYARQEWTLPREGARAEVGTPRVTPPPQAPRAPAGAQVWYRAPDREALVFAFARAGGRVVVLPVDLLSNARLGQDGNADLLESLLASLGRAWAFDEYHHGLSAAVTAHDAHLQRSFDVYLAHVAVVYLLALLALGRRFGPAWREPPPVGGSAGGFLLGLGALHHRLGHHAAAARRLVERAVELHPRLHLPGVDPAGVRDGKSLLALGRAVGEAQSGGGRAS